MADYYPEKQKGNKVHVTVINDDNDVKSNFKLLAFSQILGFQSLQQTPHSMVVILLEIWNEKVIESHDPNRTINKPRSNLSKNCCLVFMELFSTLPIYLCKFVQ